MKVPARGEYGNGRAVADRKRPRLIFCRGHGPIEMISSTLLPLLVLLARRRGTVLERPDTVFELQHQQPIVLARGPQSCWPVAIRHMQVNLRRAPVGTARDPTPFAKMIGPGARVGRASGVVVRDLLWTARIADVEHADAGIEVTAGQRGRVVLVVHAAVVAAVGEGGQAHKVGP